MDSIAGAWKLLIGTGAGTGGVLLLRWFWWRINAWSEISVDGRVAGRATWRCDSEFGLSTNDPKEAAWMTIITVTVTTATWLVVTFLTRPEPNETLLAFLPAGPAVGRLGAHRGQGARSEDRQRRRLQPAVLDLRAA